MSINCCIDLWHLLEFCGNHKTAGDFTQLQKLMMVINHVQLKTFSSYVKFDTMENLLGASPQVQEKAIRKDAVLICINIWMTYL